MTLDDVAWYPPDAAVDRETTPRKCRHPKHLWRWESEPTGSVRFCSGCGHRFDELAARRGRNSRYRGKRLERVAMREAGIHTGNANKADDGQSVDGMFAYQVKSRATSLFPGWQSIELDKLRVAHAGKVPVLTVIEAPGPGRKPRKLAVLEWRDWLDLHGDAR